ncbi:unnamed protein product [Porites lobata]|uniref:RNase H type-1 domain-containing protein n=1 Tax=Porites lobata TaxID=104759 RepID=A0ABN8NTC4_9CNID|nr:unnamed protein product [Porites lobata]
MLSPQLMETLITRVADEVPRRLSPAEVSSNPSPAALSTLQEVPVSFPVGQNTEEVASTVVQQSLANASTALTGSYFFLDDLWLNSSKLNLFTDASGAHGFGAIFGSHWCYGKWPANWEYQNIAILEFYPIVLSLYLWGEAMSNQCILFFTDNESLVQVINRQTCKDKHFDGLWSEACFNMFTSQYSFQSQTHSGNS